MTTVELGDMQAWLRAERGRQIRMRAVQGGYAVTLRERPAGGAETDRVTYGETLETALDAAFGRLP